MTKNPPGKISAATTKAPAATVNSTTLSTTRTTPASRSVKRTPKPSKASKPLLSAALDSTKTATKNTTSPKKPTSKLGKKFDSTAAVSQRSVGKETTATKQIATKRAATKESNGTVTLWPGTANEDNTIRVRKAGEVVAERFRQQIANGALAIGHQLPSEEELTTMFGIARTTLREALRVLESQGLLEIKRGRGGGGIITMPRLENLSQSLALVLQLQRTTLGDLDDARMLLEPPLAGRLASQHTDEDLEVLTAIVDQAHQCAETDDKSGFGKAAAALHEAIIERGGNNTMAVIGALLHDLMDRHLRSAAEISDHEQMSRAVRSYRKLIMLIESGDPVATSAHWHRQLVFLQQHRASIQMLDIFNA
jgi:GntR family transcriptional regulator, transcriptional repressor for pyruvate dehydrogenase complex